MDIAGKARIQSEAERLDLLRSPMPIEIIQLQTTPLVIWSARADADFQITSLFAANVTATDDFVTLHNVPSLGSPAPANMLAFELLVPARSLVQVFNSEGQVFLDPGNELQALCGVNNAVNLYGSGYDYQGQYST